MTSVLDGISGQLHAPTALLPGKESRAHAGQAGWLHSHSVSVYLILRDKSFASVENRTTVVQSVAGHDTEQTLLPGWWRWVGGGMFRF